MFNIQKMEDIKIYYFDTLESTNDKAKEFECEEDNYIIYTKNQTNGRGQYDRRWISKNGLTFSIVLKELDNELYKIVPQAIVQYLKSKGIDANIKLPNDIYYKGKKLGGILIENIFKDNQYEKTIIGIGLNINEDDSIGKDVDLYIGIRIEDDIEKIMLDIYNKIRRNEFLKNMSGDYIKNIKTC